MLCRAAFLPQSLTRGVSAGLKSILRARAFMTRFILQMQMIGLAATLTCFGNLLSKDDGSPTGSVVVMGVSHFWDETKQFLREHRDTSAENRFLKQPTQRIAKTVLVQTSMVNIVGIVRDADGSAQVHHRAETYLIPAYEMAGKSAAHLAKAILSSAAVPLHELAKLRHVASRVSALVLSFWGELQPPHVEAHLRHVRARGMAGQHLGRPSPSVHVASTSLDQDRLP